MTAHKPVPLQIDAFLLSLQHQDTNRHWSPTPSLTSTHNTTHIAFGLLATNIPPNTKQTDPDVTSDPTGTHQPAPVCLCKAVVDDIVPCANRNDEVQEFKATTILFATRSITTSHVVLPGSLAPIRRLSENEMSLCPCRSRSSNTLGACFGLLLVGHATAQLHANLHVVSQMSIVSPFLGLPRCSL